jgi:hypothetical protein
MIIIENPLKIKYKFIKFEVNSETISEFQLMERSRLVRTEHVRRLKSMIVNGNHFDSPIIINDKNGKKRIIDGQHRLTAIKDILNSCPEFKIYLLLVQYENLSASEEKEMFVKWNSGTRQSSEDFLQIYTDEMPVYDYLRGKGLISIYNEPGKIKFRNLVQPYIMAQAKNIMQYLDPKTFIKEAKKLTKDDFEKIENFANEFKENIGLDDKIFMKASPFYAVMFVYFTNRGKDFWYSFKRVKNFKRIQEVIQLSGRVGVNMIRMELERQMFEKEPESAVKMVQRKFEEPMKIWTDDKIQWLKENYEKTELTISELLDKFNQKFKLDVTDGCLKSHMKGIIKDPEIKRKMSEENSFLGRRKIYTQKILDLARKCAQTMTLRDAYEKIKIEVESPIGLIGFRQKMCNEGIRFVNPDDLLVVCDKISLEIIKKNIKLPTYEIRDKLIEKTGHGMTTTKITSIIKKIEANLKIPEELEEMEEQEFEDINKFSDDEF